MSVGYHVVNVQRDFARDVFFVRFDDGNIMELDPHKFMLSGNVTKEVIAAAAAHQRKSIQAFVRVTKFGSAWLAAYDAEMLKARVA